MKCPYFSLGTTRIVDTNEKIDEESGADMGYTQKTKEIYEMRDCLEDRCAVWRDGWCHYNG